MDQRALSAFIVMWFAESITAIGSIMKQRDKNRLESNTEHWNALLLSLRELIEWVIRKDTELTGLGPVCGDVAALQKQQSRIYTDLRKRCSGFAPQQFLRTFSAFLQVQNPTLALQPPTVFWSNCFLILIDILEFANNAVKDDHRGFRRQLEDKRPVVENNLLSGRQYIANEPPLSDTSDSEAKNNSLKIDHNLRIKKYVMVYNIKYKIKASICTMCWLEKEIIAAKSRNTRNDSFALRARNGFDPNNVGCAAPASEQLRAAAARDFAHSIGSHVSRNVPCIGCCPAAPHNVDKFPVCSGKCLTVYPLFAFSIAGRELDGDSRGYRSAEEQARELTRSIRREVNKLSEQWNALIERSDAWKRKLDDTSNVSTLLHSYLHRKPLTFEMVFPDMNTNFLSLVEINSGFGARIEILQEASDDIVTRLNFSIVSLYDCYCNLLYEKFHLSERLCALEGEQPDHLLASTEKRRSETSCFVAKAILRILTYAFKTLCEFVCLIGLLQRLLPWNIPTTGKPEVMRIRSTTGSCCLLVPVFVLKFNDALNSTRDATSKFTRLAFQIYRLDPDLYKFAILEERHLKHTKKFL
ncbi:Dystrophin, isoforms A/C/F/G [Camponotus floridanus]|uniref:Dystrophin, isoforms A/C/F/G n=1 Tax=Camponotus floridanus TaxID=104421 RepID=E2A0Q5_CAMFO|nr:Dystrophin, isoforms A/C/F/G [Camponotus floridanus]